MPGPIRDRILVQVHVWEGLAQVLADCGVYEFDRQVPQIKMLRLTVPPGTDPDALLARLKAHPGVKLAAFEETATSSADYNAPITDPYVGGEYWGLTWHHGILNTPHAWRVTKGHPDVVIATVDTGLIYANETYPGVFTHEDMWEQDPAFLYDIDTDTAGIAVDYQRNGHGVMVAGQIFAPHNGVGIAGIAPGCTSLVISVADVAANSFENPTASNEIQVSLCAAGIIKAVEIALTAPTKRLIINNSWHYNGTELAGVIGDAIAYALAAGALVIAAAGNDERDLGDPGFPMEYPAEYPGVVCVGALMQTNLRYFWSNGGTPIDVVAPTFVGALCIPGIVNSAGGVAPGVPYWSGTGTSSATPVASAVAGLIWSANRSLTADDVGDVLRSTSTPWVSLDTDPFDGPAQAFPNALGTANAAKGTLTSDSLVHPGVIAPYVGFLAQQPIWTTTGIGKRDGNGAFKSTLSGTICVELAGYCHDANGDAVPVTHVELWLGTTRVHSGAPGFFRNVTASSSGTAQPVKVVAYTAAGARGEETYTDIVVSSLTSAAFTQIAPPGGPYGTRHGVSFLPTWTVGANLAATQATRHGVSSTASARYAGATALGTARLGISPSETYAEVFAPYLARGMRAGLSWVAGPWAWIEWPRGAFGASARHGFASSSSYAGTWSEAETLAQSFGFASVSSFAAAWSSIVSQAARYGVRFDEFYSQGEPPVDAPLAHALGFESESAFVAAFAAAQQLATALRFASVAQFVAVWEEAATVGVRLGLDLEEVYFEAGAAGQTIRARFGMASESAWRPAGWSDVPAKVSLFDRSTRLVLSDRAISLTVKDRSTRLTLSDRSDD